MIQLHGKHSWLKAAVLIAFVMIVLSRLWLPIMQVEDGCMCGCRRKWFEMPDSPFRGRIGFQIVQQGDTTHNHQFWDAQWGVWLKLPWQR